MDTVNGTAVEVAETIPGMIRAAAAECSKARTSCATGLCAIGYLYDYADSGFFNGNDVFDKDSKFPDRVSACSHAVSIFHFCPHCGTPIDRGAVASMLGVPLDKAG